MVRITTGTIEPIQAFFRNSAGNPLPGKSDLYVRVMREDGFLLDWADLTFKAAGWTTLSQLLTEVDGTNAPGIYEVTGGLDTSAITNIPADADLVVFALQTPGTDAILPDPSELKVGQWVDDVVTTLSRVDLVIYHGAIWIDTSNGSAGTTVGVHGTPGNPVTTLADALTLSGATGIRALVVISGSLTLTSSLTEFYVELRDESEILFNGQNVNGTEFSGGVIKGIMSGTISVRDSQLEDISGFLGHAQSCGFQGTITLGVGAAVFHHCHSHAPGLSTPTIDFVGAGRSLNLRAYSGGIQIENMVNANNLASVEFTAGQIILDSSCTAGMIAIRGVVGPITDNSAGTTVNLDGALNRVIVADDVWDEDLSSHLDVGSSGEALDGANSGATAIADAAATWPPVTGSVLDRLANKDGSKTYDQATDSLEAVKDRIG